MGNTRTRRSDPSGLGVVEACRRVAEEIWRGERARLSFGVGGLNSERAVRIRLGEIGGRLAVADDLSGAAADELQGIGWAKDDPLSILERTERVVELQRPEPLAGVSRLAEDPSFALHLGLQLLVTESLAGRIGRWAVRDPEVPDARLARSLFRDLAVPSADAVAEVLESAQELYARERFDEAARRFLEADRAQRTPVGLFSAAVALWKAKRCPEALWAIRTCLLEDVQRFERPDVLLRAHMVESSLRTIVEGPRGEPAGQGDLHTEGRGLPFVDLEEMEPVEGEGEQEPTERIRSPYS